MFSLKTYQVVDSSALKNSFDIKELDEPINPPKPKNNYNKAKVDTGIQKDKLYGIENEGMIPVRNIEIKVSKESPIEKLFNPTPIVIDIANWQVILLIVSVTLIGFTKAFSSSRFHQSIKALFNYNVAQEITREEKVFFHRSNLLFTLVHLFSTSLFLYHIKEVFNTTFSQINNFLFFLLIIVSLISIYSIKYIFSKLLFFVFDNSSIAIEYIFNVSLFNNLLGIILIPILCITYFSALEFNFVFIYIASPLLAFVFLFRTFRLCFIGITKGISYFYIFLYICTLEILPLVVLFRILIFK
ncbi:MAG: hypothetical protein COA97_09640 [Flavobacteriales bacterium]|nr:MAG: hypothetical protein COA97_09640 [Flavobacteriales bacterium]